MTIMTKPYLINIPTIKCINFCRLPFPRFLTSSFTKSMAAVRGLYKSSIISVEKINEAALQVNIIKKKPERGADMQKKTAQEIIEVTIAFPDIFMRIFIPQHLIIVIEAQQWKYYLKHNDVHLWLHQLIHAVLCNTAINNISHYLQTDAINFKNYETNYHMKDTGSTEPPPTHTHTHTHNNCGMKNAMYKVIEIKLKLVIIIKKLKLVSLR